MNLLHVGGVQQVMLEVRVAEINRVVAERIGVNFNTVAAGGRNFGVSQLNNLAPIAALARTLNPKLAPQQGLSGTSGTTFTQTLTPALTAMGGWTALGATWTMFLDLLKQQNLGRVLAEPNLVTTSGQQASFLAGGQFPYPLTTGTGASATTSIQWQNFGVQLEFTPTVLNDSKIAVKVHPTVSELDFTLGVQSGGTAVPGLRVREMNTLVEVNDGQTFAIAGLLSDTSRNIVNKFPVLGDIPILGALFRSTEYNKNLTELVALVTPHLVKPMPPGAPRLPTDKWIEPTEVDVYLLGLDQGRQKPAPGPAPAPAAPLPPQFGHQSLKLGARRRRESHAEKGNEISPSLDASGAGAGAAGAGRVLPAQRPGDGLRQFGAQQRRPAGGKPPGRLQPEARGGAVAPGRGQRDGEIRQSL